MKSPSKLALRLSALALIAMVGSSGVSHAGPGATIVAGPLAAAAGYLTKKPVILQGQKVKFTNLDIAVHDVRSTSGLFSSALVGLGKSTQVNGTTALSPGKYGFYCSIHPNMTGTLTVRKLL
jgi:plastocyanin